MKHLSSLMLIFFALAVDTSAQLCGTYSTTLFVKNEAGQPVENVRFEINPVGSENYALGKSFVREKSDAFAYAVSFAEGSGVKGKYNVIVSAPGFSDAKREIGFPHCARPKYEVVLKPARAESVFRELIEIRGELWKDKNRLGSVALTATAADGKIYKAKADENGLYNLNLPLGNYTLLYQKAGYKTLKIVNAIINVHKNIYIYNAELESLGDDEKDNIVVKDFKDLYKSFSL